ncbi:MAG: sigma-54-dependent Fis family transcriptional regulator [Deltaproteobacteria bacterium]|nr:sigma-54-dependent Fis family transcriptional regulator [Deltaproteobacteria bacterium]
MNDDLYPANPVLLVDDEQQALTSMTHTLLAAGITHTLACLDSRNVLPLAAARDIEAVLLDLTMPDLTGEEVLALLARDFPHVPVIVITGVHEIDTAVRCLKIGAFDYLTKPVEPGRITASLRHALELRRLQRENSSLKKRIFPGCLEHPEAFAHIITNDSTMYAVFQYCEAIAPSGLPVLITGETGTGKELIARSIHALSGRQGQFVPVNVAGLDENVFSDTLFGHRKGAFTGADEARQGLIVKASGGTLFLDEIGDLHPASQVKLLRLLQEREYFPLGSDVPKEANVRIVAATNRDIQDLQQKGGNFRKDLFYRLCSHHIQIPPVRQRMDDLQLLCEHFLDEASRALNIAPPGSCDSLLASLSAYDFPGNIRELQAIIYNAVSSHSFESLPKPAGNKPAPLQDSSKTADTLLFAGNLPTLDRACDMLIGEALRRSGGNQTLAAKMLGISRQTLIRSLKKDRHS